MHNLWRRFLAFTHLSDDAVCEMSAVPGLPDYHDWQDATDPYPVQCYPYTCRRCGKEFTL